MIWFEWKKIFGRRLNIIAMISGYVLIAVCMFNYITQERFYDKTTDTYLEGMESFSRSREQAAQQTKIITDEYITQLVQQIQNYQLDLERDDAYMEVIRPLGDIFYFTVKNYTDMREEIIDNNVLNAIDLSKGAQFYKQRMAKIKDYLNMDFSSGNYKEAEKQYWIQKAENVEVPFRWGSKREMSTIWEIINIGFYLVFVIIICVSPVFASEYESGAAALLLTTKFGKNRLIYTKILASVIFTVGYLTLGNLLAVATIGLLLGFHGADLPVQLWNSVIPYSMNAAQVCLLTFAIILLISITIALFLLCCSAGLRSSLAVLVIGVTIMIAPAFFPMSKESGLWNHLNYLFPVRAIDVKEMLGSFVSYTVGNFVISYLAMVVIVYTAVSAAALAFTRKGFVRGSLRGK